ncbi:hypothetical protein Tco_0771039 [Tanacetum coccineum]|uniref:Uncharacterized protein n=1 Tax=Tanacetum coccineum TaxID=301880 RepID=A0ABQ4ZHZ4_9ASTR
MNFAKNESKEESFSNICMDWVIKSVHGIQQCSRTSKDNEDPGWNTSFKTRRTQKTTSSCGSAWNTIFYDVYSSLFVRNIPPDHCSKGESILTEDKLKGA